MPDIVPDKKSRPGLLRALAARFGTTPATLDEIDRADQLFATQAFNGGFSPHRQLMVSGRLMVWL
jgi:hypothetical protein